ncbi:MAG: replication initiator protein A [Actinomycetota bacterium]|jgi:plasmid replication initiation protein|nr:replication initiator protein A [Actinomycetota bacterium]
MAGRRASSRLARPNAEEHLVKAESNLEEYPFFAIKRRNRKLEARVFERILEGKNGASLRQQWKVMPSVGYGPPGPLDQDIYLAVLELLERKGGMPADGKLRFSLYELVELLGWSKSGKNGGKVYRDVRDSLERIGATRIKSENAFYSKERDSYISDSFNIWSVHLMSDRSREGEPRERHSLEFHPIFIRNFQTQYLKGLDADFYWSLHSPLARRLYRLIDQQRRGQLTFQQDLFTLREQIPLANYPYASKIKEALSRAHEELTERGFISEVGYEGETIRYRVSGEFVRRQKALELSGDPEEIFAIRRLMAEGVRGDIARDLVARYGSDKCLRYAEALVTQKGIRNRAGWLRKAIEESYDLPETLPLQHPTRDAGPPSAPNERNQRTQAPMSAPEPFFDQGRLSPAPENPEDLEPSPTPSAEPRVADPKAEEAWEALVADLVALHGRASLPPWFEQFEGGQLEGSTLTVVVPNSYAANHLNENFGEDLVRLWRERSGEEGAVVQVTMDLCSGVRARLRHNA